MNGLGVLTWTIGARKILTFFGDVKTQHVKKITVTKFDRNKNAVMLTRIEGFVVALSVIQLAALCDLRIQNGKSSGSLWRCLEHDR